MNKARVFVSKIQFGVQKKKAVPLYYFESSKLVSFG